MADRPLAPIASSLPAFPAGTRGRDLFNATIVFREVRDVNLWPSLPDEPGIGPRGPGETTGRWIELAG